MAALGASAPYTVAVNWSSTPVVSRLRPTLQIVPNPMSYRGSPSGAALSGSLSGDSEQFDNFTLDCGEGGSVASVDFVAYGSSSGYCGSLEAGSCVAPNARDALHAACLGKRACIISRVVPVGWGALRRAVLQARLCRSQALRVPPFTRTGTFHAYASA